MHKEWNREIYVHRYLKYRTDSTMLVSFNNIINKSVISVIPPCVNVTRLSLIKIWAACLMKQEIYVRPCMTLLLKAIQGWQVETAP